MGGVSAKVTIALQYLLHVTRFFQEFNTLLELTKFAGDVLAFAERLVVFREPGLKVRAGDLLEHPGHEAVAQAVHEKMVDLLGDHVRHASAHHIGVGENRHLRRTRRVGRRKTWSWIFTLQQALRQEAPKRTSAFSPGQSSPKVLS